MERASTSIKSLLAWFDRENDQTLHTIKTVCEAAVHDIDAGKTSSDNIKMFFKTIGHIGLPTHWIDDNIDALAAAKRISEQ